MQMGTAIASPADALEQKIKNRTARVGIVGLGYVGLPLAMEFAKAGFSVTGIDAQGAKVEKLNAGESYVQDVPNEELRPLLESGKFRATTDFSAVAELDTINIAVPTPLRKTKDPDMSFIVSACGDIAKHFGAGKLLILESTTYPGTTDELVLPMLERPGLKVGEQFFLCFSPERVDPGNPPVSHREHPQGCGWNYPGLHQVGRFVLFAGDPAGCSGELNSGGGNGQAAGKYLPHDQHWLGERNGADVRPNGHQRLGSN